MKLFPLSINLCFFFCALIIGCSKNGSDQDQPVLSPVRSKLIAHLWINDSTRADQNGVVTTLAVHPPPQQLAVRFDLERYYTTITNAEPIPDTSYYELEEPSKIYHWKAGGEKDTGAYFMIRAIGDDSLILAFRAGAYTRLECYHAR